jgi:[acyl-carrier-protein] S-malonyltransferase
MSFEMSGLVFIFPGQGSQKVGMGADLQQEDPTLFERYMAMAEEASGLPITRLCLEGPLEDLTQTQVAQPALFALSLALAEKAQQLGIRPDFVAGHSLGEYTAAVVVGAISAQEGMRLVAQRGKFMAEIQAERPGAMGAVIGLPADVLDGLCERVQAAGGGLVRTANLNTPSQIVVSGEIAAVEQLIELAKQAGAARAQRLAVGAGFHSKLMEPVQQRLAVVMDEFTWHDGRVPMAANFSGELVAEGPRIHEALLAQITSPVQWVACTQRLLGAGGTAFLELGAGRVLGGLVRQISAGIPVTSADSVHAIDVFARQRESSVGT